MREIPSLGSPFGHVLFFEPGEINELCQDALAAADCLPESPQPVEIETFIETSFRARVAYTELGEGILGCTVFDARGQVSTIGAASSLFDGTRSGSRRARSTLAHEVGHGLLHGTLFANAEESHPLLDGNYDSQRKRLMCREQDLTAQFNGYSGRWWEWQANQAIGGLLLPSRLLVSAAQPFTVPSEGLGIPIMSGQSREVAIKILARTFDVNPVVARIRLSQVFPDDGQMVL